MFSFYLRFKEAIQRCVLHGCCVALRTLFGLQTVASRVRKAWQNSEERWKTHWKQAKTYGNG